MSRSVRLNEPHKVPQPVSNPGKAGRYQPTARDLREDDYTSTNNPNQEASKATNVATLGTLCTNSHLKTENTRKRPL